MRPSRHVHVAFWEHVDPLAALEQVNAPIQRRLVYASSAIGGEDLAETKEMREETAWKGM